MVCIPSPKSGFTAVRRRPWWRVAFIVFWLSAVGNRGTNSDDLPGNFQSQAELNFWRGCEPDLSVTGKFGLYDIIKRHARWFLRLLIIRALLWFRIRYHDDFHFQPNLSYTF